MISYTDCSTFYLKVAARLPFLSWSASKIDVSRILLIAFAETRRFNGITFVLSAFYAYVWRILEGTQVKRRFFPGHIIEMGFV